MKHSELQCDTRFMTACEEKLRRKMSKQPKAAVKCNSVDRISAMQPCAQWGHAI